MGLSDYTPPKCNVRKPEKVTFFVDVYVRVELRKMLLNGKEARKERGREKRRKERRQKILEDKFIQHIHAKKLQKNQLQVKERDMIQKVCVCTKCIIIELQETRSFRVLRKKRISSRLFLISPMMMMFRKRRARRYNTPNRRIPRIQSLAKVPSW